MVRYLDKILHTCSAFVQGFAFFCMVVLTFGAIILALIFLFGLVSQAGLLAFVTLKLISAITSFALLVFLTLRKRRISIEKEFWRRAFMVFLVTASFMGT